MAEGSGPDDTTVDDGPESPTAKLDHWSLRLNRIRAILRVFV